MLKPDRLRRLWRAVGAWGHRDPILFIAAYACWMGLSGISLLASFNTFSRTPVYAVAADLGLNDDLVGAVMLVNALFVAWGLGDRPPSVRSSIALTTGILWTFWGFIMLAGGLRAGLLSSGGAWTVLMSLALMRVSASFYANAWPRNEAPGRSSAWDVE